MVGAVHVRDTSAVPPVAERPDGVPGAVVGASVVVVEDVVDVVAGGSVVEEDVVGAAGAESAARAGAPAGDVAAVEQHTRVIGAGVEHHLAGRCHVRSPGLRGRHGQFGRLLSRRGRLVARPRHLTGRTVGHLTCLVRRLRCHVGHLTISDSHLTGRIRRTSQFVGHETRPGRRLTRLDRSCRRRICRHPRSGRIPFGQVEATMPVSGRPVAATRPRQQRQRDDRCDDPSAR